MKKKLQNSRMYLAGLALLAGSTFAWAMPSQWLTSAEEVAAGYGMPGDANEDGTVDIVDVTTVVDHILGNQPLEGQALKNADVNSDESVDIVDLTSIIDIILGN
jgi:hypothetical protein